MSKQKVLDFWDNDQWTLRRICIEKNCKEVSNERSLFGVEIDESVSNFCTNETGTFYVLGRYPSFVHPKTYKKSICSDSFKLSKFSWNKKKLNIRLCTPRGFYSSILNIINDSTMPITVERPEYGQKKVTQIYAPSTNNIKAEALNERKSTIQQ